MNLSILVIFSAFILMLLQSLPLHRLMELPSPLFFVRTQADLVCVFCVYLGVHEKSILKGAFNALLIGLLATTFMPENHKISILLAPMVFITVYWLNVAFFFKRLESYVAMTATITIFHNLLMVRILKAVSPWSLGWWNIAMVTLRQVAFNAVTAIVIFCLLDWLHQKNNYVYTQRTGY